MKHHERLAPLLVLLSSVIGFGQSGTGNSTFSAIANYGTDSVNLQNLSVNIDAPIRSKTGAIPFSYSLFGNSGCAMYPLPPSGPAYVVCGLAPNKTFVNGSIADSFSYAYSVTYSVQVHVLCPDGKTYTNKYTNWIIVDPLGGKHPLPLSDYTDSASCLGGEFSSDYSRDGSGLTYAGSVYTPDGIQNGGTVVNPNGNTISVAYTNNTYPLVYTDTLSTTALQATPSINESAGSYSWTDINGNTQPVTETMTPVTVKTAFGCQITDLAPSAGNFLTKISYPDNSNIQLSYEATPGGGGYTGRIQTITLRTGGTVTYKYSGGKSGLDCIYLVPPTMTRTTSDGTWTYTWTVVNNGNGNYGNTTSVVDPGGNKTVYTFTGLSNSGNASFPTAQVLTQVQHYQGSSTLLNTTVICYNGNATNCSTAVVSYPVSKRDAYTYPATMTLAQARLTEQTFDAYGNVLTNLEYDYNQALVSTTTTTYGTWNGSTCVNIGSYIYSKTCEMKVIDSGAHTLADKRFSYDSHGNLLTSYLWNGSAWLSKHRAQFVQHVERSALNFI